MAKHKQIPVDEVSEQVPEESLNDFLGVMFNESVVSLTNKDSQNGLESALSIQSKFKTKSAQIRYCFQELHMSVNQISKHLHIRYQMVRNVLLNQLKRGPNEPFTLGEQGGLAPLLQTAVRKNSEGTD